MDGMGCVRECIVFDTLVGWDYLSTADFWAVLRAGFDELKLQGGQVYG